MPARWTSLLLVGFLLCEACFHRTRLPIQTGPPTIAVVGDSLSEGVQSADANRETQPVSYASRIALQMRGSFPLPLIDISPIGVVGNTFTRHRLHPHVLAADVAVSGATVADTLAASAEANVENEFRLVLAPRLTTEIGALTVDPPPLIIYWAGSNDIIPAVLTYDKLDATQITKAEEFRSNFTEAIAKLKALGRPVVIGNIPDVTQIAFVMDRRTLEQFAGSDFGLPEGSYTTLITALLLRLGLEDASILKNPDYVLDPGEIIQIQQAGKNLNSIIGSVAADAGFPVVDVYSYFQNMLAQPAVYGGATLSNRYLGGLFSLDGIHPSDISHALLANEYIRVINSRYASAGVIAPIPALSKQQLDRIARHDPFVDHKANGTVKGRFGAGLLETLAPFLGLKHDELAAGHELVAKRQISRGAGEQFMAEYRRRMNQPATTAKTSRSETHDAMCHVFGLNALKVH